MSITTKAGKAGVAALAGVLAVGVATCTGSYAQATTAAKTASAPAVSRVNQVTNLTPFTWTYAKSPAPVTQAPLPPQTVLPGQTVSWNGEPGIGGVITDYRFTDSSGGKHEVDLESDPGGYLSYSSDWGRDPNTGQYGYLASTNSFHMQADSDPNHVDAVWNSPTMVEIDGATDPASAAAAVTYELPRALPGLQTWKPAPGSTPTFQWGSQTRATSMVYNYSSEPVTVAKGHDTTKGQSTSLSEEVTASASADVFGVGAKVAASVTSDQEWGSSDSVGVDVDTEVEPGHVGWINKRADTASLTGDLTFPTTEGITFILENVTISKGDIVNTGGGGVPVGMDYTPYEQPITAGSH